MKITEVWCIPPTCKLPAPVILRPEDELWVTIDVVGQHHTYKYVVTEETKVVFVHWKEYRE
jgi:hypothetical protein